MKQTEYDLCGNVVLGYWGEHESREVVLDIGSLIRTWPELTPKLVATRPGETDCYPCRTRLEGDLLIWEITENDTAIPGTGECRVHMIGTNGEIGKSRIAQTVIRGGMKGEMKDTPPVAMKPWVDSVLEAGTRAESAAKRAEDAAEGVNEAVRDALQEAKDSGEFKGDPGADGHSPEIVLERTEDGVKITAVNKEGEESETVLDGKDGKAADTFVVLNNAGEALSATPEDIDAAAAEGKAIFLEKDGVTYTYAGKAASSLDSSVHVHVFLGAFERRDGQDFLKEVQFKPSGAETIIRFAPILTPNPNKLILTGAVSATYDGTSQVMVEIPEGGTGGGLPTGGEPHQMLVTDGEGNAKWDERTHWVERVSVVCLEETELMGDGEGMFALIDPMSNTPTVGGQYTVTYNGTPYECAGVSADSVIPGGVGLGNVSIFTGNEEDFTDYPFGLVIIPADLVADMGASAMFVPLDGAETVILSIEGVNETVHKLDSKFISSSNSNIVNGKFTAYSTATLRGVKTCEEGDDYTMGDCAVAFGSDTKASGEYSAAFGDSTIASGMCSAALGCDTESKGMYSFATGLGTIATEMQIAFGRYNVEDAGNEYLLVGGQGTPNTRKNVYTLSRQGDAWYAGSVYVGGTAQGDASKVLTEADIDSIADAVIDETLSKAGQAADAKATGDALNSLNEEMEKKPDAYTEETNIEVIKEVTLTGFEMKDGPSGEPQYHKEYVDGLLANIVAKSEYTVILDGVTYENVPSDWSNWDCIGIGNQYLASGGFGGSDYSFYINDDGNGQFSLVVKDDADSHTLAVYGKGEPIIHTIDEKYIPDSVKGGGYDLVFGCDEELSPQLITSKSHFSIESGDVLDVLAKLRTGKPVKVAIHVICESDAGAVQEWCEAVFVRDDGWNNRLRAHFITLNENAGETVHTWNLLAIGNDTLIVSINNNTLDS